MFLSVFWTINSGVPRNYESGILFLYYYHDFGGIL